MSYYIRSSFGVIPPYKKFLIEIRRQDEDGKPFWREGEKFDLELGTGHQGRYEAAVLAMCGFLPTGEGNYGKPKYEWTERQVWKLVHDIMRREWSDVDLAWGLASSIMYAIGYEWV